MNGGFSYARVVELLTFYPKMNGLTALNVKLARFQLHGVDYMDDLQHAIVIKQVAKLLIEKNLNFAEIISVLETTKLNFLEMKIKGVFDKQP